MATAVPSLSSLPKIHIGIDGKKLGRVRLSDSSSIAQLRTTISEKFQLSSNTYFLDNKGYRLNIEDEKTKKIRDLLNNNRIIQMEADPNIPISEKRGNISQQRSDLNFASLNLQTNAAPSQSVLTLFLQQPQEMTKINKWKQPGITIAGGNGEGNKINQLCGPYGIFIDNDKTIYIADCCNHRIVQWKSGEKSGQVIAGGNGSGNRTDQLSYPMDIIVDKQDNSLIIADQGNRRVMRWSTQNKTNQQILISGIDCGGLAMDRNGFIYASDALKHEVRRWKQGDTNRITVAGGNGRGDQLNQLNVPTGIFVDEDGTIYVSDSWNQRVMKWKKDAREGIIVAGRNGKGDSLTQLSDPKGVIVDHLGRIYVANWGNHRVMRWCEGSYEGSIVAGGNGTENQLRCPIGLSFDVEENLYVSNYGNNQIQKFEPDFD